MRRRSVPLLIAGSLLAAVFILTGTILTDGLIDTAKKSDVGIVLGSMVMPDGTPSSRLKARLDKAVELYRQGMFPAVIVSGGTGKEGFDEAAVMQRYLVDHTIPESAILADGAGSNTNATARNSAILMKEHGFKSATVITQYFHIFRSRLALKSQGIDPVYTAHPDFYEWRDIYSISREVVACATSYLPEIL